ncbi:ABC-type nitrate/sulfonate/bicarbonate transport system substrate-binding protein [Pseudacidovorax intermedius]|uniref:ABC-type nitrate/sulfonate/bicarbonate transport system substrate-binding protein n=1 Tax=Pseudacidovorax intermedius TaxID=433924 RepID=A0A370F2P3_9BURK|nr:ABC transporter substrate-binding protein [Pseudacidovorax intermedius]RDI17008.1 ABC-type nitrate/sulfonate/bicarbonate transport system substrate-binding protein [Pseudacidovorax intermedius]
MSSRASFSPVAHEANAFTRRRWLQAAGAAGATLAAPAFAQTRPISITLPWVVNGSNYWPMVGKELGFFKKRGIDLTVSRGNGSVAAAQAVANKQFDMGVVFFGGTLVNMARGLPLQALATVGYDSLMGNLVLADSPIRGPKDFEGKRVGTVATSAESPYWAAYAAKTGIDLSKVTRQQLDARLIERALMDRQVDAITAIGSSSIPVLDSLGVKTRFIPWASAGIELYAAQVIARTETIQADPGLCQAMVDGILESVVYTLKKPEESLEILFKAQPEIALAKGGKENARLSQGLAQATMVAPEAIEHGMGYSSIPKLAGMISLAARAGALKADAKPLVPEDLATNRFAGRIKLSSGEWDVVRRNVAPYAKMVGMA